MPLSLMMRPKSCAQNTATRIALRHFALSFANLSDPHKKTIHKESDNNNNNNGRYTCTFANFGKQLNGTSPQASGCASNGNQRRYLLNNSLDLDALESCANINKLAACAVQSCDRPANSSLERVSAARSLGCLEKQRCRRPSKPSADKTVSQLICNAFANTETSSRSSKHVGLGATQLKSRQNQPLSAPASIVAGQRLPGKQSQLSAEEAALGRIRQKSSRFSSEEADKARFEQNCERELQEICDKHTWTGGQPTQQLAVTLRSNLAQNLPPPFQPAALLAREAPSSVACVRQQLEQQAAGCSSSPSLVRKSPTVYLINKSQQQHSQAAPELA